MEKQLKKLRNKIDTLDGQVLRILAKRFEIVKKIGILKKKYDLPIYDKKRWKALIDSRVITGKNLYLAPVFVRKIFSLIHSQSLKIEKW